MTRRLRDDLLRRLLLPMAAVLLFSGTLSYQLAARFTDRSYDRSLLEDAKALVRQIVLPEPGAVFELPAAVLDVLQPGEGDRAMFQVRTRRRGFLGGDPDLVLPNDIDLSEPVFLDAKVRNDRVRVAIIRIYLQDPADEGILMLAETRLRRDALTGDIVAAVVAPQFALIFFAIVAIIGGVSSGLQPLVELAQSLEERQRDELTPLAIDTVPGEAIPLIRAFNGLLGRVTEILTAQRRFVADAAHQLRTPLAALRLQLEQVLQEDDADCRQALLEQLRASVDRTARLSGQLLLLARAEPSGAGPARVEVDLRALTRAVGSQWVPRAIARRRDLGIVEEDGRADVLGDPVLLEEMLSNLIDNALRYGGPRITLRVVARANGQGPALVVEDNGPGIPVAECERVFERFHRVPGTVGEGSGLGLAIVREIARSHDATVMLDEPPGGGLRIRVGFPGEIR